MLEASIATMVDLHNAQMAEMENALSSLNGVLNRPDSTPTANIAAEVLNTSSWLDIDKHYPAQLTLRLEYARGLERMGPETPSHMQGALANLERISKLHQEQWSTTLAAQPRGLVLPSRVLEERTPAPVKATIVGHRFAFMVPLHLGKQYIKRDIEPWLAVIAHVTSEPGMQFQMVDEHRIGLPEAVTVLGTGPFSIDEHKPDRAKIERDSQILPSEVCQSLRGEVRFIRQDTPVPLRAAFRASVSAGGVR
jgi:hypothetical protein